MVTKETIEAVWPTKEEEAKIACTSNKTHSTWTTHTVGSSTTVAWVVNLWTCMAQLLTCIHLRTTSMANRITKEGMLTKYHHPMHSISYHLLKEVTMRTVHPWICKWCSMVHHQQDLTIKQLANTCKAACPLLHPPVLHSTVSSTLPKLLTNNNLFLLKTSLLYLSSP